MMLDDLLPIEKVKIKIIVLEEKIKLLKKCPKESAGELGKYYSEFMEGKGEIASLEATIEHSKKRIEKMREVRDYYKKEVDEEVRDFVSHITEQLREDIYWIERRKNNNNKRELDDDEQFDLADALDDSFLDSSELGGNSHNHTNLQKKKQKNDKENFKQSGKKYKIGGICRILKVSGLSLRHIQYIDRSFFSNHIKDDVYDSMALERFREYFKEPCPIPSAKVLRKQLQFSKDIENIEDPSTFLSFDDKEKLENISKLEDLEIRVRAIKKELRKNPAKKKWNISEFIKDKTYIAYLTEEARGLQGIRLSQQCYDLWRQSMNLQSLEYDVEKYNRQLFENLLNKEKNDE